MFKVAIIAVNEGCEEREKWLQSYLAEKLAIHKEVELMNFSNLSVDKMIQQAQEADRTIIVFDAVRGMNSMFAHAATELYRNNIKPILLIANCEFADETAEKSLVNIWSHEANFESWQLKHKTLYFSYEKKVINLVQSTKNEKLDVLKLIA